MRWTSHRKLLYLAITQLCFAVGCTKTSTRSGSNASAGTPQGIRHGVPELRAKRVAANAITIDGKLDEPIWQQTGTTGPFVAPSDGTTRPTSPVNAHAKVAWNATMVFFAFVVADKNPTSPFSPEERDPHVWERSSAVELMIQPGDPGNNKHYYEVQVDVVGAVWDTRFDDYNHPISGGPKKRRYGHQDWVSGVRKGIVVHKQAGNYTMELAIPWTRLAGGQAKAPPKANSTWRINFYSFRDGQRHALAWSPILGQGNFHKASRFGRVHFVP